MQFIHIPFLFSILACIVGVTQSRLAGECAMLCNDLRTEVLTLQMCRDAKKTLPRPKVGDFCSTAMEQGFSDACVALCTDTKPVGRVAQACRAAAIEMPRPTVRRWCEHGYNVAFTKTVTDLATYFTAPVSEAILEEAASEPVAEIAQAGSGDKTPEVYSNGEGDNRPVVATVPVTLDDAVTKELVVHEGENAEEAVVLFCRANVAEDEVASCIRQLLMVVLDKISSA